MPETQPLCALPVLDDGHKSQSVVFTVYAPFGQDPQLTTYPNGAQPTIATHPLTVNLQKVAETGVHVCALVDLSDSESFLVEIPAHGTLKAQPVFKVDMNSHYSLAQLIVHARNCFPDAAMVLALEGHGAGFIPDIDLTQRTTPPESTGTPSVWVEHKDGATPYLPGVNPVLPGVNPVLTVGAPILPGVNPVLPGIEYPMSTWRLGEAMRLAQERSKAQAERGIAIVHFNNCFNMSTEVLHTIEQYAQYAVGYMNYNFFTSGDSYPKVFSALQAAGSLKPEQLARAFSLENQAALKTTTGDHPTTGGAIALKEMPGIAKAVNDLSKALIDAMVTAPPGVRKEVVEAIRDALSLAQNYDTNNDFELETPDGLTDLASFAAALSAFPYNAAAVVPAANALAQALKGVKVYGDVGAPWMTNAYEWNFSSDSLAMNILFPDPLRLGLWDWRSPYYLQNAPGQYAQPNIIAFLQGSAWVDFIVEYHKDVEFKAIRYAAKLRAPGFAAHRKDDKSIASAT
jgi:hypothetical protein